MRCAAWLSSIVFLSGGVAWAQPYPTVTAFPLDVRRSPAGFTAADESALAAEFERLLRKSGADVPDSGQFALALKELRRQDCDRDDECLKQLAQLAHTLYAMYVQVDNTLAGNVVALGRVVRSDGIAVGRTKTVTLPRGKKPFGDVAAAALERLLAELGVGDLPPQRTVTPDAPKVAATPAPPPSPALTPPPLAPPAATVAAPAFRPGLRRFAWAPGAVTGLAAAGAGVTWGLASDAHQQLSTRTWSNGADPVAMAQRGEALQVAAAISTGVAAAAAGVLIWFLAVGDSPGPLASPPPTAEPAPPADRATPGPGVVRW